MYDARHGKIETGAVVRNRKGSSGVEGEKKVLVISGKKRPMCEGKPVQFPA